MCPPPAPPCSFWGEDQPRARALFMTTSIAALSAADTQRAISARLHRKASAANGGTHASAATPAEPTSPTAVRNTRVWSLSSAFGCPGAVVKRKVRQSFGETTGGRERQAQGDLRGASGEGALRAQPAARRRLRTRRQAPRAALPRLKAARLKPKMRCQHCQAVQGATLLPDIELTLVSSKTWKPISLTPPCSSSLAPQVSTCLGVRI